VTSQLGGSAHKRGLVNPDTGRIVLYTYRDIILTFTVKVSINIIRHRLLLWIRGMISSATGSEFRIRNVFYCGFRSRSDLEQRHVKNRVRHHFEVCMNCDM
jgi:hypothetical protein